MASGLRGTSIEWHPNSKVPHIMLTQPEPQPEPEPMQEEELDDEEKDRMQKKAEAQKEKEAGNAAYKARKFQEAVQHYDRAIELDDSDISLLTNR